MNHSEPRTRIKRTYRRFVPPLAPPPIPQKVSQMPIIIYRDMFMDKLHERHFTFPDWISLGDDIKKAIIRELQTQDIVHVRTAFEQTHTLRVVFKYRQQLDMFHAGKLIQIIAGHLTERVEFVPFKKIPHHLAV